MLSETNLAPHTNLAQAAQHTQLNQLIGTEEEVEMEDVVNENTYEINAPAWRVGTVENVGVENGSDTLASTETDLTGIYAGGSALGAPIIIPGSSFAGHSRTAIENYIVAPGDSLSSIAYNFNVSVATVLWENGLTERSVIRVGQTLRIPPGTGLMYTVAKGDTIKKIATKFKATEQQIAEFNSISGSSLAAGTKIFVPGGVKPAEPKPVTTRKPSLFQSVVSKGSALSSSNASASAAGFIWPSSSHIVTQYFNPNHHAMDIAGPWQTPTYAAQSGVVITSQCGWNGGYGCYVVIDHGNGIKTLYGHHSVLMVSVGDTVQRGQVLALMGNTGNVRGLTGIHLHFEVIVNGVRVNPLGYIR